MNYAQEAKEAGRAARKEKMQRMFDAVGGRKPDQIKELEETKEKIKEMDRMADDGLRPLENKQKTLKKLHFLEDQIEQEYKEVLKEKGQEPPKEKKVLIGAAAADPKFEKEFQARMAEVKRNNDEIEADRAEKALLALEQMKKMRERDIEASKNGKNAKENLGINSENEETHDTEWE